MLVYLDTNVYKGANYRFDNNNMSTLQNLVTEREVTVLYTDATIGEVKDHIESDIKVGVAKYNNTLRKDIPMLNNGYIYPIHELDSDEAIRKVKQKLEQFMELKSVIKIPLNPLDADKLFEDYFSKNPPFENKKPCEFKDAIMINAVKNYQKKIGKQICIVSNDGGFRKAFNGYSDFKTFNYLSQFLKYYADSKEELNKATNCIERSIKEGEFNDAINKYVDICDICMSDYQQYDIEDKEIEDISIELLYIEKTEDKFYAILSFEVSMELEVSYRDEDRSYFDKEDDRYLFENYIKEKQKHKANIELKFYCDIKKDDNNELVLEDFEVITDKYMRIIDLNDFTKISSYRLSTTYDDESDPEFCSQYSREGGYKSGYGECPICGFKIPLEHMESGFCEKCAHEKD